MGILFKNESVAPTDEIIPAVINDEGYLEFRQNGISAKYFSEINCEKYASSDFMFYCDEPYLRAKGESWKISYFVYTGEDLKNELWQIFYVARKHGKNKGKLLYSVLKPCQQHTHFCRCEECGKHYIINRNTYEFYMDKKLILPVNRCPTCREKKKILSGE